MEKDDDRNHQFRCQLKREQPLRSTSNDVCQVTDRCNVDFQFLPCAPVETTDTDNATQLVAGDATQPACHEPRKSRRLTKKTKDVTKRRVAASRTKNEMKWLYGCNVSSMGSSDRQLTRSFLAAFRKAYAMDFYITKYQGKMMEALTPLFQAMTSGIHRLEQQEKEETAKQQQTDSENKERKKRRTKADLAARARRMCIRLAAMANRCYWLSTTEVTTHILTGGDALQSHHNQRLFTRQLQWAMQQCKRMLNNETVLEDSLPEHQSVQTVTVQLHASTDDVGGAPQPTDDDDDDIEVVDMAACTTSTNTADDYAHRGLKLQTMPFYVYRMYVRRIPRRGRARSNDPTVFAFEPHYALAATYAQEVFLHRVDVPTIDGFQCPTWSQDPEQNSLLKLLLFTPWVCHDPMICGSCTRFQHMVSNCSCPFEYNERDAEISQLCRHGHSLFMKRMHARREPCAATPSAPVSGGLPSSHDHGAPQPAGAHARKYSFERAWRLRCSEIHVLAERANIKRHAAQKKLVLADTTLFANVKEPHEDICKGDQTRQLLKQYTVRQLRRTMPAAALMQILGFSGLVCFSHAEQCSVAEFCAYVARDVISHIDLAAEARVKTATANQTTDAVDEDSANDSDGNTHAKCELVDIGGGQDNDVEDFDEDVAAEEVSSFPLHDHEFAIALGLQTEALQHSRSKARLSQADKDLLKLEQAYGGMLQQLSGLPRPVQGEVVGMCFRDQWSDMVALQRQNIALAKKQRNGEDVTVEDSGDAWQPGGAPQPADDGSQPAIVPLPLAIQGPAAAALRLVQDAQCTEEQTDAVALLALSLQKRFDSRPDKSTHQLPVATAANNHRAVWLGGGGVGKTRTLQKVVEPLAVAYFGDNGYAAAAQSNHAAQNLGLRGRTLHAANGLLMTDSLQTAKLRLNARTQRKMDHLVGNLGVDVIDELGCVSGSLLHADALRKTYGRALRHTLQTTSYMKPQETWGRMAEKLLCGDFYQLPPVPPSASLMAPTTKQTYEHQQGRKILADMEHVIDFVQMQRFNDPLQIEVLEAMRTPGGKKITDEAWQAIVKTEIKSESDERLRAARGWYESAYEWRIVSYAMHAQARLDAHDAGKILFYIPAIDKPAGRCGRKEFDEMRAEPNISRTTKLPSILPVFIGMDVILGDSLLPPKYVRGTACKIVGIEPHPREPAIEGRASINSHGCVLLHYMPKHIYVKIAGADDVFLQSASASTVDLKGVLAITPQSRPWTFKPSGSTASIQVSRSQVPLLPQKQCTLHGVQGKTAEPGFIVHWTFPPRLALTSKWLATYVSLSRPRSFTKLLSHGLPDRAVIESGLPEETAAAFAELFTEKIAATKVACAAARVEMGWPARR